MIFLKNEEGLTLIEAIIALVVMLILVTAFAGAMTVGLQSEIETEKRLLASDLASSVIEYLGEDENLREYVNLNNEDNDVDDGEQEKSFNDLNELLPDFDFDNELFRSDNIDKESSIINVKSYENMNGLYNVKVIVYWTDRGNRWNYELNSLLYLESD